MILEEGIAKGVSSSSAATDLLKSFMGEGSKDALFDSKVTHIGIACGCHIKTGDFCCLAFGSDVKEKSTDPKGVINVEQANCDESTPDWHKNIKGQAYEDKTPFNAPPS